MLKLCVIALSLTLTLSFTFAESASGQVKNVLVIGVDDLNTNVGAYGADWVRTPHIDRLASRGVKFNRAYAPSPICNVSRVAFLSGLYPETSGVLTNGHDPRDPQFLPTARMLPEVYQDAGYFTAAIGKTEHRQHQGQLDVDTFINPDNTFTNTSVVAEGNHDQFRWQSVDAPDSAFGDGQVADHVIELLNTQGDRSEPFFIHAGFKKPHQDFIAPKRFFDAHLPEDMPLMPEGIGAPAGTRGPVEGRNLPEFTDAQERDIIAAYSAATSFMDSQVGRVLDAMDNQDLWDDTAVVFYSDHGYSLGQHGHWSKFNQFDSSARIPFIIASPGIDAAESDTPVDLVDIFPTLMELSGLDAAHKLDGDSLVAVLEDPNELTDGVAYSVFGTTNDPNVARVRSIRTPDYNYIRYFDGSDVLFAAHDIFETQDLSEDPAFAGVLLEMQSLLDEGVNASIPEPASLAILLMGLPGLAGRRRHGWG